MQKLQLKGKGILEWSGLKNAHQLSLKTQVSYPTIERYVNRPETIQALDINVFSQLITAGLNLSPEEALALPLSALFEFVESEG